MKRRNTATQTYIDEHLMKEKACRNKKKRKRNEQERIKEKKEYKQ